MTAPGGDGARGDETVGAWLRRAREGRGLSLGDVARATRIQEHQLERLEAGRMDELPAPVFVRGFVRMYARAVGLDGTDALRRLDETTDAQVRPSEPGIQPIEVVGDPAEGTDHGRRRVGVALFVLVLLIVATLAVSLLLRKPDHITGGLSSAQTAPAITSIAPV